MQYQANAIEAPLRYRSIPSAQMKQYQQLEKGHTEHIAARNCRVTTNKRTNARCLFALNQPRMLLLNDQGISEMRLARTVYIHQI
jgi:hypothetical protein